MLRTERPRYDSLETRTLMKRMDIVDLALVGLHSAQPHNFHLGPYADIDNDAMINIIDLAVVAANFGPVDP